MEIRTKILGLILLGLSVDSGALTLGRMRGAAIVGQPLDVSIQIQLGPDETASSVCMEADVFHADTRLDPSRVRVSVEPGAQAQQANLRVTSSVYVDEPVVTIYLKAGCGQKVSRRYVMLADYPSEPASPTAPASLPLVVVPAAPVTPAAVPQGDGGSAANTAPNTAQAADTAQSRVAARPAQPAKARPPAAPKPPRAFVRKEVPATMPKPAVAKAAAPAQDAKAEKTPAPPAAKVEEKLAAGREAGQSRLKLDPLVMLAERVASLESSSSAPPADVVRESQRVQSIEDSVKALVALAAKNEANLQDLRTQLQKAESERIPMQWIYGLVALLLACLAAIAYLWSRLSRGGNSGARDDWWSGSRSASQGATVVSPSMHDDADDAPARRPASAAMPLQKAGNQSRFSAAPAVQDDPDSELDVSMVEMSESNFDSLMQSNKAHSALRKGPLPASVEAPSTRAQSLTPARPINSEQLFDIRQQAEFFVSLGQTDQAVRILENQINDSGESSPLVYLDLLKIFHSLNLKTDFRQFREDFNLLFNGRVPEFGAFKDEGKDLESYPEVLAHITAVWGTPRAQIVIESSIFRDPQGDKNAPFDLAAFRDLLLLHAVAQSTANRDAPVSDLAPLHAGVSAGYRPATMPVSPPAKQAAATKPAPVDIALNTEAGFLQVGAEPAKPMELDLDLSDLVEPSVFPFGAAESAADFPKVAAASEPTHKVAPQKALPVSPVDIDVNLINFDLPDMSKTVTIPKPKG